MGQAPSQEFINKYGNNLTESDFENMSVKDFCESGNFPDDCYDEFLIYLKDNNYDLDTPFYRIIEKMEIEEKKYNLMTDEEKKAYDQNRFEEARKQEEEARKREEEHFQKIKDSYDGKIHIQNDSDVDVRITTYSGGYFGTDELTPVEGVEVVIVYARTKGFVQLNDVPNWNLDNVMNPILNPKVLKIEFINTGEVKQIGLSGMDVSAWTIEGGIHIHSDYRVTYLGYD